MSELRATDIIIEVIPLLDVPKFDWRISFVGWLGLLGALLRAHECLDRLADLEPLNDLALPFRIRQLFLDDLGYGLTNFSGRGFGPPPSVRGGRSRCAGLGAAGQHCGALAR